MVKGLVVIPSDPSIILIRRLSSRILSIRVLMAKLNGNSSDDLRILMEY
jgi:hypothetical protein